MPDSTQTGFCASCAGDGTPSGVRFGPLPPCHADACSFAWRDINTTNGQIIGDVQVHPAGAIECVDDTLGNGLAVRTVGGERAIPTGCTPGSIYRDPTSNRLWVEQPDVVACDCDSAGGCASTAPGGAKDATHTGCAGAVCATIKNTHCAKPMRVIPTVTILGAELDGGQATYEFVVNGVAYPVFTAQEPKVSAHNISGLGHTETPAPSPASTITHTGDTTLQHQVTRAQIASYSGSFRLPPVTVQPGATYELCANPRVRYRNDDTGSVDVTWGSYSLCLDGSTACNGNGV